MSGKVEKIVFIALFFLGFGLWFTGGRPSEKIKPITSPSIRPEIRAALSPLQLESQLPERLAVKSLSPSLLLPTYSIDPTLQTYVDKLLASYRPDWAAFVAMEADTGRILSIASYSRAKQKAHLALRATYPAASIFKIISSAAVLDKNLLEPFSEIDFRGRDHTLYQRQLTGIGNRKMTLREAFAKSVNPVFGRLGMMYLDPSHLQEYATKFLLTAPIDSEIPVEEARFELPSHGWFEMAELASGFNRVVRISPLHGALIAATVANDGVLSTPRLVDILEETGGKVVYSAQADSLSRPIGPRTAEKLRELMRETVSKGTSRKSFRRLLSSRRMPDWEFGGKTGSLDSDNPKGKCEWFVGYGRDPRHRIAVAAMTISEEKWRIKPADISRLYFEQILERQRKSERLQISTTTPQR